MKVRALEKCYINHALYERGQIFDLPSDCLATPGVMEPVSETDKEVFDAGVAEFHRQVKARRAAETKQRMAAKTEEMAALAGPLTTAITEGMASMAGPRALNQGNKK